MSISSVNRVKTIALKLDSNSSGDVIPIYTPQNLTLGSELIPNHTIVSYNCFFKNLRVFASIKSIEEAALPDFTDDDSDTDKLYKTLDVEWKSPRKQLSTYIKNGTSGWLKVGAVSLLNPIGYPFRQYNLQDMYTDNLCLELGSDSAIGITIDNVGYGLLSGDDTVTIHGNVVEEIFVTSSDVVYTTTGGNTNTNNNNNNNTEDDDMSNWLVKNSDYAAAAKDKIIIDVTNNLGGVVITLPPLPSLGQCVAVQIYGDFVGGISFSTGGAKFRGGDIAYFRVQQSNTSGTFIYMNSEVGWITDLPLYDTNSGGAN